MQSSNFILCYVVVLEVDRLSQYADLYSDIFLNFTFHKVFTNYMSNKKQFYFYFVDNISQDNFLQQLPQNSIYSLKGLETIENPTENMETFFNG